ncbi:MAG: hypothetical protein QW356_04460 [Candidatus Hadarchaeales archaeon]
MEEEVVKLYVCAIPGVSNPSYFGVGSFRAVKGDRELYKKMVPFKGTRVTDFGVMVNTVIKGLDWLSEQGERRVEVYLPWTKVLNLLNGTWTPKESEPLVVEVKLREKRFERVSYLPGRDEQLEGELRAFFERRRRRGAGTSSISFISARGREEDLLVLAIHLLRAGMASTYGQEEFYLTCKLLVEMFEHSMHYLPAPGTTEEVGKLARELYRMMEPGKGIQKVQKLLAAGEKKMGGANEGEGEKKEEETFYIS